MRMMSENINHRCVHSSSRLSHVPIRKRYSTKLREGRMDEKPGREGE